MKQRTRFQTTKLTREDADPHHGEADREMQHFELTEKDQHHQRSKS